VNSIKNKKSLILLGTFGILTTILLLPTTLGFTGTVVPCEIVNTYGYQTGLLEDIQTEDDDYVQWKGAQYSWFIFLISTKVYFPEKSSVGTNNEVEMELKLIGGGSVTIQIFYTDGTYDSHSQGAGGWRTVIYDLDNYKIVDYVKYYNLEWWYAGILQVDYVEVNY